VVALPQLEGPRLPGLPADGLGFIQIDEHARVVGLDDVYAAGDATDFPIKQGGIATQQADAAVEMIAGRHLEPYLTATARPGEPSPSADRPMCRSSPRELHASHHEARELALSFALADANHEDHHSALRWLEVVERLDGVLPPGYLEKRTEWRDRAHG